MRNYIIFLCCMVLCCAPTSNKSRFETIEPKIDIQQARNIALEFVKGKYNGNEYIQDSISVHKTTKKIKYWEVWIKTPKIPEIPRPPYLIIIIDKITGKAEDKTNWVVYGYF